MDESEQEVYGRIIRAQEESKELEVEGFKRMYPLFHAHLKREIELVYRSVSDLEELVSYNVDLMEQFMGISRGNPKESKKETKKKDRSPKKSRKVKTSTKPYERKLKGSKK